MKTKRERILCKTVRRRKTESGNGLVYVLIAIALFAALSFTLGRQTDTSETGSLDDERAGLYATQLISYAAQAKSAVDQMLFVGASAIDDLDFTAPTDGTFDTAPLIHKVYHPQGGGLVPGRLPEQVISQVSTTPRAGWYLGRFNNVEWTATSSEDVILVAYQIDEQVCELINERINGSTVIPSITGNIRDVFVDESVAGHSGTNVELTTDAPGDICPDCHNVAGLCVSDGSGTSFSFYTIIADQ